jgi:hypothetical protein
MGSVCYIRGSQSAWTGPTGAPLFGIFPKISTTVEITVEKPDRYEGSARMVVSFPAISLGQTWIPDASAGDAHPLKVG